MKICIGRISSVVKLISAPRLRLLEPAITLAAEISLSANNKLCQILGKLVVVPWNGSLTITLNFSPLPRPRRRHVLNNDVSNEQ